MDLWNIEWTWTQIGLALFVIVYAYLIVYQIYESRFLKTKVEKVKDAMKRTESTREEFRQTPVTKEDKSQPRLLEFISSSIISLEMSIRKYILLFIDFVITNIRVGLIKLGFR
jgi:Tfp pilus assembly protein PilE